MFAIGQEPVAIDDFVHIDEKSFLLSIPLFDIVLGYAPARQVTLLNPIKVFRESSLFDFNSAVEFN